MNVDVANAMAQDAAIEDACRFLEVDRPGFFELALQWDELGRTLWDQSTPETFYTSWREQAGRSNLCRNIIDQFGRRELWEMLWQIAEQRTDWWYLDYGCGSAAVSWPILRFCRQAVLADVPNLPREFVTWRIEHHQVRHATSISPEEALGLPDGMVTMISCVDVLEHLRRPSVVFDALTERLAVGGVLFFRAPWARPDEDFGEHLQDATADWHRLGGGETMLRARYQQLVEMRFGGVYIKRL